MKCPAGYKTVNGTCEACEIGTYNGAEGAIDCIACGGDKTTYGTGSTKQDQCYELCTVPDVSNLAASNISSFFVWHVADLLATTQLPGKKIIMGENRRMLLEVAAIIPY